ncbi:MAG: DUF5667 domain-containing protein [Anaerolineae bacterium]
MAKESFEQVLERCLQDLERTGDFEAVVDRYPDQAEELRSLMEIALATERHYADVPVPPGDLAAGRERMLAQAARERERVPPVPVPATRRERGKKMRFAFATRLIGIMLAVVVGLSAIGGGAALAAEDSLPGDALYPIKLAVEDVRMGLASDPEAQVALALQLADERTEEIEALIAQGETVPESVTARMERHLYRAMRFAAQATDEMMPGLLEEIAIRTQTQTRTLVRVRANAPEQDQTRLETTQRTCEQAHGEAQAGLDDPETFRLRHQERDSMPGEVMPPEPPDNGDGPQGPGGPNTDPTAEPQGAQEQNQGQTQPGDQNQGEQPGQQHQNQNQPDVTPTVTPQGRYRNGSHSEDGNGKR